LNTEILEKKMYGYKIINTYPKMTKEDNEEKIKEMMKGLNTVLSNHLTQK